MSDTKTILEEAAKLWWLSLGANEAQRILINNDFIGTLVTDEWKLKCYLKEHPTTPIQEFEKDNKFEYKVLKQWENVGFSDEDNSRDCYMAGAKYAKVLLKEQNQVLVESIERMNEEYVKLKKENTVFKETLSKIMDETFAYENDWGKTLKLINQLAAQAFKQTK